MLDEARGPITVNSTFWSMLHVLGENRPEWVPGVLAHRLRRRLAVIRAAVDIREPRPFHRTTEDGKLLPKSDILEASSRRALNAEMRAGTNDEIIQAWCWQTGD